MLVAALALVVAAIHIRTFQHFYCDDALISMRYAQRFLGGHGLTWTDGPRVEGYSNLLWILGCSLLGLIGIDLIAATRVLGVLAMLAVFAALVYRRVTVRNASVVPFAAGITVWSLSAPAAAWVLAGLETPLVAALLAWGLVFLMEDGETSGQRPRCVAAGVCFGFLCLTRPDGPLFTVIGATWLLLLPRGYRKRNLVRFLIPPMILVAAQLVFRLSYYGEWLPNVWYVKISPSLAHFVGGAKYVMRGFFALMPVSALAVAGLVAIVVRDRRKSAEAFLLLAVMMPWLAYVAFIGGDIFHGWRHMVPFVVAMVLGLVLVLERFVQKPRRHAWRYLVLAVVAVAWFVAGQRIDESNRLAKQDTWVWNTETVGRALAAGFGQSRALLAICAAGGIPYWSELPCIDMLGLNDSTIARTVPPDRDHWIGHEHADAKYLMSRHPDFIHFGTAGGRRVTNIYKPQLDTIPEFENDYTFCAIGGWKPHQFITRIYVNQKSPRVGIVSTADSIDVPPYFLKGVASMWDETRAEFVVTLHPMEYVVATHLPIQAGSWEVVLPPGTEAQVIDSAGYPTGPSVMGGSPLIEVEGSTSLDLAIRNVRGTQIDLRGLKLVRR